MIQYCLYSAFLILAWLALVLKLAIEDNKPALANERAAGLGERR